MHTYLHMKIYIYTQIYQGPCGKIQIQLQQSLLRHTSNWKAQKQSDTWVMAHCMPAEIRSEVAADGEVERASRAL